jgi:hypothetical protein
MSQDDSSEKTLSTVPSENSELAVLRAEVNEVLIQARQSLFVVQGMQDNHEKLWTRTNWLTKLEASKAEHILALAQSIERQIVALDKVRDAIILNTQRNTEIFDQREYIRAGLDSLRGSIEALHTAIGLERKVEKAIKRGVREATDKFPKLDAESVGKVGVIARVINKFLDAPPRAQLLLVIALALALMSGWVALALHRSAEAQGEKMPKVLSPAKP